MTTQHGDSKPSDLEAQLLIRLTPKHLAELRSSALSDETILAIGHFSANVDLAMHLLGLPLPGLIFNYCGINGNPYLRADGRRFCRIKPDWEEGKQDKGSDTPPKYLSPANFGNRPYFSRLYNWKKAAKCVQIDAIEAEGEKKADAGCAAGLAVIGFGGVWGWVDRSPRPGEVLPEAKEGELEVKQGKNQPSKFQFSSRVLPELDEIEWAGRRVFQCFDSDIIEKSQVQAALFARAKYLDSKEAYPFLLLLPNELDGSKNGLDDFIARHGREAVLALKEIAQPSLLRKGKKGEVVLNLLEPSIHCKVVMVWTVLKEKWAYRATIGWYEWQGTHWCLKSQAYFEADLTRFADAQRWVERSSNLTNSLVRELQSRLLVREELWDSATKVAFTNGTLDRSTNRFAASHNRLDWITKIRPYAFDLEADCPIWRGFLEEATGGNQAMIGLLQAWCCYVLLPRSKNRKAEIEKSLDLFGPKGTGKGTFLETLIHLVGSDNVGPASPETFRSPTGLGQLIDKDLAVDTDCTGFLDNIGVFNKVVSNEPVEVKKLYRDSCTMRLGVVVVRAYNAVIQVPDGSEGLDRRLTVVPFKQVPRTIDIRLSEKLSAEMPGIFAWAYQLDPTEMRRRILSTGAIAAVAEASIERFEANNPEYRFLMEVFPTGAGRIAAGELFSRYQDWCGRNAHGVKSQTKFGPAIQALGCQRSKKTGGTYYYEIPVMKNFDVAAHLGIIAKKVDPEDLGTLEEGLGTVQDTCQDTSTPLPEGVRDTWGDLDPKLLLGNEKNTAQALNHQKNDLIKESSLYQSVPSIPNPVTAKDTGSPSGVRKLSPAPEVSLAPEGTPCKTRLVGTRWRSGYRYIGPAGNGNHEVRNQAGEKLVIKANLIRVVSPEPQDSKAKQKQPQTLRIPFFPPSS